MELKRDTKTELCERYGLLIVPYGIETSTDLNRTTDAVPFNRTLWN